MKHNKWVDVSNKWVDAHIIIYKRSRHWFNIVDEAKIYIGRSVLEFVTDEITNVVVGLRMLGRSTG
jgi:hypothetical protein